MLLRNLFMAVKGLWVYNFENKLEGKEQIKKAMEILLLAAQLEVAQFHQERFKMLVDL
ncbi:hypothetical protein [Lactococcus sp. DD01]|uniref:hypothetical protein n=1 Tax=Lactococcus sp. DD01 TaxID=1776443 RepID=UPI000AA2885A|nr:hypothetical protein [Lactococcus sp. DD01]